MARTARLLRLDVVSSAVALLDTETHQLLYEREAGSATADAVDTMARAPLFRRMGAVDGESEGEGMNQHINFLT